MKNTRLKYHVTDDCLKRLSEEYIDSNASLDLEDICSTKGKNTFFVAEKSPEMQNPMTLFTMEKHNNNFYCIKYISPFEILLIQTKVFLHASQEMIPSLFPKNVIGKWMQGKTPLNQINDTCSAQYLGYKISCLTLMMMALECFVNEIIPDNLNKGKDKDGNDINKEYIERRWSLKQKMQVIRDSKQISDSRYNTLMSQLLPLYDLRNEFVHLKSVKPNTFNDPCLDCYEKLFSTNLLLSYKKLVEYAKLVNPNIVTD